MLAAEQQEMLGQELRVELSFVLPNTQDREITHILIQFIDLTTQDTQCGSYLTGVVIALNNKGFSFSLIH